MIFAIHTSNVQPFIVLDGIRCANSACPETVWAESIDLSPNTDLESRSGASTLETQVCYNYAPEATVSYVATKGGRVTTYDPRWLLRVNSRLSAHLWGPTDWSRCS